MPPAAKGPAALWNPIYRPRFRAPGNMAIIPSGVGRERFYRPRSCAPGDMVIIPSGDSRER